MTQHITVITASGDDGTVIPDPASVWRDDQVIMWGLAAGLEWIDDATKFPLGPIEFLPQGDGFSTWMGTTPAAIGPRGDGPDRRFYVAMTNFINPTDVTIRYHYRLHVINSRTGNILKVLKKDPNGNWIDPDVGNEPQP
jgi:hypothetical protein